MNEWTPHKGGPCPVPPETIVLIRHRNGEEGPPLPAGKRRWETFPPPIGQTAWDIVEWRLAPL